MRSSIFTGIDLRKTNSNSQKSAAHLRLNLFMPLAILIVFVAIISVVVDYQMEKDEMQSQKLLNVSLFSHRFEDHLKKEAAMLDGYLNLLLKEERLQQLFVKGDREGLNRAVETTYKKLHEKIDLTHLYFIDKEGRVLLRAHDPARHSDIIPRYTFLKAKELNTPFHGIEFGIKKNYTLRVVHPWIVDGKIIGYMELGKEVDKLMETLASQLGVELYLAVDKKVYESAPDFVHQRLEGVMQTESNYISYRTWDVPDRVGELLQNQNEPLLLHMKDRVFIPYAIPMVDVSGERLGSMLFLIDTTTEHNALLRSTEKYTIVIILLSAFVLGISFLFIRQKEQTIRLLTDELQRKNDFMRTLIETAPLPIFAKDFNGRYIEANRRFLDMFGLASIEEIKGKSAYEITSKEIADIYSKKDEELFENPQNMQEYEFVMRPNKSDKSMDVIYYKSAFFNPDGSVGGVLGLIVDITERKAMEEELRVYSETLIEQVETEVASRMEMMREKQAQEALLIQQSKMAAMGEMIGAIAHQWKQPLNVISFMTQDLTDQYVFGELNDSAIKEFSKNILQQIRFMSQTVDDFRNFFKPSKEKQLFIACETIQTIYAMFKNQFKLSNTEVTIHPHEHFQVLGYPNEFKQVILNLLNNARDVIVEKKIMDGHIDCHFETKDGMGIIRIKDNGGGIPEALLPDKLFDPYVSTKGEKGTGIGLSMSKTIIEKHMGGKLWVHNVGDGAEFVIELSLAKKVEA